MRTTGMMLAGLVGIASLGAAAQAAVVLTPDVGSYTGGDGAVGTVTSSYVATTSYAKAGRTWLFVGTYETRGIVEIGLTSVPANAVITSAYLDFSMAGVDFNSGSTLKVYGYAGNGTVESADYGQAIGSALSTINSSSVLGSYSIDVTTFVQNLIDGGAAYAGFAFRDTGSGLPFSSYTLSSYYNSGNPSASTGPRLVIEYEGGVGTPTPEAASLAILALPAGALLMRRRKS